jgi:hypothetical protein
MMRSLRVTRSFILAHGVRDATTRARAKVQKGLLIG